MTLGIPHGRPVEVSPLISSADAPEGGVATVRTVRGWLCRLPLAHPLKLGPITYYTRDYVVVEVTTDDGEVGHAIGYTRGTPLLESVAVLAAQMGDVPADPVVAMEVLRGRFAPGWAALTRAASLVDIALWDLKAKREGVTVARALGFTPTPVPAMAVAGYFADVRPVPELLEEMDRFVAEGYTTMKLILAGHSVADDRRLIEQTQARMPDHVAIGIDFHGAFRTVEQAVDHCRVLQELDVAFIEDPFPSAEWRKVRDFAAASAVSVAAGEDVPGLSPLMDLIDGGVRELRADVTASGGFSVIRDAVAYARDRGARLRPHVWPHLHVHIAASAADASVPVEVIPDHVGADPIWMLLQEGPPMKDALWCPTDRPGLGLPLDRRAVEHHAVEDFAWMVDG